MSYTYLLVKMASHVIDKKTPDLCDVIPENVINWEYANEEVKKILTKLYPSTVWDSEELMDKLYGKNHNCITGEVFDLPGRFSFVIDPEPRTCLGIHGSHHVNQRKDVIAIAKELKLSAFDAQTGECVYVQK